MSQHHHQDLSQLLPDASAVVRTTAEAIQARSVSHAARPIAQHVSRAPAVPSDEQLHREAVREVLQTCAERLQRASKDGASQLDFHVPMYLWSHRRICKDPSRVCNELMALFHDKSTPDAEYTVQRLDSATIRIQWKPKSV